VRVTALHSSLPTLAAGAGLPMISVVIPARNEARSIAGCLDAILAQRYPRDLLEILVVDGGSRDTTTEIVRRYASRDSRVRLLDNPSGAIPAGLNIGIRNARGTVIARVDARSRLREDYLETGIRLLMETGASNVGGSVRSVTQTPLARILAAAMESRFGMGGAAVRYRLGGDQDVDTVYLGMYPRSVLERIGLYDEEMQRDQDDELNFRLNENGGRVRISPSLVVTYLNSPSLERFVRQQFLYGFWKVRVCQKHPTIMSPRHLVPPAFTLGLLAAPLTAAARPGLVPIMATVLGLYGAGAIAAAAKAAPRIGWRLAMPLPGIFFLMHATWGLGFLSGLVRFLPRWFRPEQPPPRLAPLPETTPAGARS
jgi:glycosyltransferase involved in cell wall biosynthesis